jgi:hypothetical protein
MRRRTLETPVIYRLTLALSCAIGLTLAACSGGSGDATAPDADPPTQHPSPNPGPIVDPTPDPQGGIQGSYVLEQINQSKPGQLVTIANPDGTVIGLYRFDAAATSLDLDALQTFDLQLSYTDDKDTFELADEGEFKGVGQAPDGSLPLTFTSKIFDDSFTGVALGDIVAFQYDLDGDGQAETKFGFRRTD